MFKNPAMLSEKQNKNERVNPLRPEWPGRSFLGEMKFVLSNFLSNEDLSISYESWDFQLTFDTMINAFRFKLLSGAKDKSACCTKFAKFRKMSVISSIFIKSFFMKDLRVFLHLIIAFGSIFFWLGF